MPKLEKASVELYHGVGVYEYLTNDYNQEGKVCFTGCDSSDYPKREIHEEWNEKIFLEACGIQSIPTLEEVKEYFKNSDKVVSTLGREFLLTKEDLENEAVRLGYKGNIFVSLFGHKNLLEKGGRLSLLDNVLVWSSENQKDGYGVILFKDGQ